jgi:tRNA dimethylallyltransferase
VAVFGPTAGGKSALAAELAGRAGGEVVSADSKQLYRGLPVLTAQPTPGELALAPHHLLEVWPIDHAGSVGEYGRLAQAAIDGVRARGRLAVVAGGTGLYLRAALADLELPPLVAPEERARFEALYDEQGAEAAHAILAGRDAAAASAVHPNDRRRVVRALELHAAGSSLRPARDRLWDERTRIPTRIFTLEWGRAALLERIERRVEAMLAGGALAEVATLVDGGERVSATASGMLGLREIAEHLGGRLSLEECRMRIVVATRRYARRQVIWLRKIPARTTLDGAAGADANAETIREALLRD